MPEKLKLTKKVFKKWSNEKVSKPIVTFSVSVGVIVSVKPRETNEYPHLDTPHPAAIFSSVWWSDEETSAFYSKLSGWTRHTLLGKS